MSEVNSLSVNNYTQPQPAPNLLGMVGQFASAQNQLNQNAMFQQEFRARQALGPVMQSSIDPHTGEFDIGKFLANGAANPDVAWKMPELVNQMIQRQLTSAQIVNQQLDAHQKMLTSLGGAAGALVGEANDDAKKRVSLNGQPVQPQITQDQAIKAVSQMTGLGLFPDSKAAASFLAKLPSDPTEIYKTMNRIADTSQGAEKTLAQIRQGIQAYPGGGGVTPLMQPNVRTGGVTQVGSVVQQPTVAERNAPLSTVNSDLSTSTQPRAALPMQTGAGTQAPGTGGEAGGVPSAGGATNSAPPTGATPVSANAPNSAGAEAPKPVTSAGTSNSGVAGPVLTKAAPTAEKYREQLGSNMGQYEKDLNTTVNGINSTMQVVQESKDALKSIKTGGGAELGEKLGRLAQTIGAPQALVDRLANGDLAASQEFQKLATQYATLQMRQFLEGGGRFTNLEFKTFNERNPNLDTDPRAIDKIYNFIQHVSHLTVGEQAALSLYRKSSAPIEDFPAWWSKRLQNSGMVKLGKDASGQPAPAPSWSGSAPGMK